MQKYEKYLSFLSENFQFLEVKFSIYLNRRVFVMIVSCRYFSVAACEAGCMYPGCPVMFWRIPVLTLDVALWLFSSSNGDDTISNTTDVISSAYFLCLHNKSFNMTLVEFYFIFLLFLFYFILLLLLLLLLFILFCVVLFCLFFSKVNLCVILLFIFVIYLL